MSNTTVSTKQVSRTATSSARRRAQVCRNSRGSLMFHATTNSSAASAAMGTMPEQPGQADHRQQHHQRMHYRGNRRTRAAADAGGGTGDGGGGGDAAESGATILPSPWPISSALGSWRVRVRPSATTAHSSDSMAPAWRWRSPDRAGADQGESSAPWGAPSAPGSLPGQRESAQSVECPPRLPAASQLKREAMVSIDAAEPDTGSRSRPPRRHHQADQRRRQRQPQPRPEQQDRQGQQPEAELGRVQLGSAWTIRTRLSREMFARATQGSPESPAAAAGGDHHADAGGESQHHRIGHELDQRDPCR
jgi:hypothetical protein